jgi:nucleoside-specific outer membrane channel protein Tsx
MKKQLLAMAVIAAATGTAQAEQFWADNSVSLLYGEDYTMTPNNGEKNAVTNMTLEHVSGHSWGSLFFFVDRLVGEGDYSETYGEFSPTFTLKKFEEGSFVKAINAAFTYEFGSSTTSKFFLPEGGAYSQDNYLYGIGADLNIPGMNYFSTTYYYSQRNNTFTNGDNDHQLTFVYGWSSGNLNIDGFLDWSTGTDQHDSELNFTPQLTYNVGPALGVSNKVKVGVEYSYWNNKFGAKNVEDSDRDQNAVSLLLKVHL